MGKINRFEDIEVWQKARCLSIRPEIYGKPLGRTLKGYWKLGVGEYLSYCLSNTKQQDLYSWHN